MISSTQTNSPLTDREAAATPPTPLEIACARLKAAGLRITQPRMAILSALIKRGQPASIEDLHANLPKDCCDLVTVYRCLAAFSAIGLVRRSFYPNGTSLHTFDLGESHQLHVVCKETNRLEALDEEAVAELKRCVKQLEDRLRALGYRDVSHVVEFFGVSPAGQRLGNTVSFPAATSD